MFVGDKVENILDTTFLKGLCNDIQEEVIQFQHKRFFFTVVTITQHELKMTKFRGMISTRILTSKIIYFIKDKKSKQWEGEVQMT